MMSSDTPRHANACLPGTLTPHFFFWRFWHRQRHRKSSIFDRFPEPLDRGVPDPPGGPPGGLLIDVLFYTLSEHCPGRSMTHPLLSTAFSCAQMCTPSKIIVFDVQKRPQNRRFWASKIVDFWRFWVSKNTIFDTFLAFAKNVTKTHDSPFASERAPTGHGESFDHTNPYDPSIDQSIDRFIDL